MGYVVQTYSNDDEINKIARDVDYGEAYPYFCFAVSF